jgi:hypothetical protein
MTEDKLIVYKKELTPIAELAQTLTIKDGEDMKRAVEVLSTLNRFNDQITEEKEKITVPLNDALKVERNRWRPLQTMYEESIEALRTTMGIYQLKIVKQQRESEQKIAARVGEGRGKLSIETAVRQLSEVEVAQKNVATSVGDVQFRESQILKIIDVSLIPREYLIVNEKLLLEDLKAGKIIAGATTELKMTPVNFR